MALIKVEPNWIATASEGHTVFRYDYPVVTNNNSTGYVGFDRDLLLRLMSADTNSKTLVLELSPESEIPTWLDLQMHYSEYPPSESHAVITEPTTGNASFSIQDH